MNNSTKNISLKNNSQECRHRRTRYQPMSAIVGTFHGAKARIRMNVDIQSSNSNECRHSKHIPRSEIGIFKWLSTIEEHLTEREKKIRMIADSRRTFKRNALAPASGAACSRKTFFLFRRIVFRGLLSLLNVL